MLDRKNDFKLILKRLNLRSFPRFALNVVTLVWKISTPSSWSLPILQRSLTPVWVGDDTTYLQVLFCCVRAVSCRITVPRAPDAVCTSKESYTHPGHRCSDDYWYCSGEGAVPVRTPCDRGAHIAATGRVQRSDFPHHFCQTAPVHICSFKYSATGMEPRGACTQCYLMLLQVQHAQASQPWHCAALSHLCDVSKNPAMLVSGDFTMSLSHVLLNTTTCRYSFWPRNLQLSHSRVNSGMPCSNWWGKCNKSTLFSVPIKGMIGRLRLCASH